MNASRSHTTTLRVAYHETDGQGRVHHANYLNFFERGRVELMRSLGESYKDFEATGKMLVVTEMHVSYLQPAAFDDLLDLTTSVISSRGARIRHHYVLRRGPDVLVEAESTIACVDRAGRVARLPVAWQDQR